MSTISDEYLLGHTTSDLLRLDDQAQLLAPATTAILQVAGLRPGMRVLDVGTGLGDVAFGAASIVGPSGQVVGIDRDADVLALARDRAAARGVGNVDFEQGEAGEWNGGGLFDAVIGRMVLVFCPDPRTVVRHHAASLRPGGLYLAMEWDYLTARADPFCPTVYRTVALMAAAVRHAGMDPALGARLDAVLEQCGLVEAQALGFRPFTSARDGARAFTGLVAAMLALMEHSGLVDSPDAGLETLRHRIAAEVAEANATFVMPTLVGAWGRTAR
jgi:SAM-dependent methyltransferase